MYVPVKEVVYSVWDPNAHKAILNTVNKEEALRLHASHANKTALEVWKIITTDNGYNEHIKLA